MNSLATMLLGPAVYSGKHTERSYSTVECRVSDHTAWSTHNVHGRLKGAHLLLDHLLEQVFLVQEEKERSCCKNWIAGNHTTPSAHTKLDVRLAGGLRNFHRSVGRQNSWRILLTFQRMYLTIVANS